MINSYCGFDYDRSAQRADESKAIKLKSAYWTTKQAMITKFRRKQDENVVASDADLDSKLELMKSIQLTCRQLDTLLEKYQRTICYLSQSENEMGRFLKQHSVEDKTQAGKIMALVGKALSTSAQQRLTLRSPLDRLHQEIRTFRQRGILDTTSTLKRMETARTEYRGALLWMKKVSEELDPDTYKQLEKFRCVQAQVRKTKTSFDRLKVDSMQKVDLLAASRCNMLSHALVGYQNTLLIFLEKISRMMVAVADSFKGYQYYEFSVLKQLRSESLKLAGRTNSTSTGEEPLEIDNQLQEEGKNIHGDVNLASNDKELDKRLDELFKIDNGFTNTSAMDDQLAANWCDYTEKGDTDSQLRDLFTGTHTDVPAEHRTLFDDLFSADPTSTAENRRNLTESKSEENSDFSVKWEEVFGEGLNTYGTTTQPSIVSNDSALITSKPFTFPSQLWEQQLKQSSIGGSPLFSNVQQTENFSTINSQTNTSSTHPNLSFDLRNASQSSNGSAKVTQPSNFDPWLNFFADLGTMGNPDTISKKDGQISNV